MTENSLRQNAEDFINYKRNLGYIYCSQDWILKHYVDHAESVAEEISCPSKNITESFLSHISASENTLYLATCTLREFSRFLYTRGHEDVYIIPAKTVSKPVPEPPYFFTNEEIVALFIKIDTIRPIKGHKGREFVFPALFRLLYCCGLRCKEARTLESANVHADDLYIDIIESKGRKSRRIFISKELAGYLNGYEENISLLFPKRKYYFPHNDGCYSKGTISRIFKQSWKQAFPDFVMGTRPRAYDLRHHFAWSNLNRWAAEGKDVNVMLPYLMRYMGHESIQETLYYFHFVPEFFPTYKKLSASLEDILPEVPDEEE